MPALPFAGIAANRVIAALITKAAQLLENSDQRQPFARGFIRIFFQNPIKIRAPVLQLGPGLLLPPLYPKDS
jgi:hypothetical protein